MRGTFAEWHMTYHVCSMKSCSALEGAESTLLMASGMCASTALLLALVPAGGHLVTTTDCYRKTRIFIETILPKMGIKVIISSAKGVCMHSVYALEGSNRFGHYNFCFLGNNTYTSCPSFDGLLSHASSQFRELIILTYILPWFRIEFYSVFLHYYMFMSQHVNTLIY